MPHDTTADRDTDGGEQPGPAKNPRHLRVAGGATPHLPHCAFEGRFEPVEIAADIVPVEAEVLEPREEGDAHLPRPMEDRAAAAAHKPDR